MSVVLDGLSWILLVLGGLLVAIGAIGILSAIGTDFNTFLSAVAQRIVDTVNSIL